MSAGKGENGAEGPGRGRDENEKECARACAREGEARRGRARTDGEEEARASCRHLGLAFNLRASRRALIRAGSSSSYEPGLRYKQELE